MNRPRTIQTRPDIVDLMLVDDEPGVLRALLRVLGESFTVVSCESGEEAIRTLETVKARVLLTDLHMPGMDGLELLGAVHDLSPDTIRILLSGAAERRHLINAVNAGGVHRVLDKPWDADALCATIRAAVASHDDTCARARRLHSAEAQRDELRETMAAAEAIQRHIMPQEAVETPHGDIASRYVACEHTTGDYLDTIDSGTAVTLAIGDVTGHGLGATLHAFSARALLRAGLAFGDDLPTVVAHANRYLYDDMEEGRFLTLFVGRYESETGELVYVNAGHNAPLIVGASGCRELTRTSLPLGIRRDERFDERRACLTPDETLLLYTDGLIEARGDNGDLFGTERLMSVLTELHDRSPEHMLAGIWNAILGSGHTSDDDLTACAFRPRRAAHAARS